MHTVWGNTPPILLRTQYTLFGLMWVVDCCRSVQLQLICDTILVLSREGFRDACQRSDPGALAA
eukprot:2201879-Rhodomonas_salina.2